MSHPFKQVVLAHVIYTFQGNSVKSPKNRWIENPTITGGGGSRSCGPRAGIKSHSALQKFNHSNCLVPLRRLTLNRLLSNISTMPCCSDSLQDIRVAFVCTDQSGLNTQPAPPEFQPSLFSTFLGSSGQLHVVYSGLFFFSSQFFVARYSTAFI